MNALLRCASVVVMVVLCLTTRVVAGPVEDMNAAKADMLEARGAASAKDLAAQNEFVLTTYMYENAENGSAPQQVLYDAMVLMEAGQEAYEDGDGTFATAESYKQSGENWEEAYEFHVGEEEWASALTCAANAATNYSAAESYYNTSITHFDSAIEQWEDAQELLEPYQTY